MYIGSKMTGKSISWNYKLEAAQKVPETTAFIVVEHTPMSCDMFPASDNVTFSNIYVEVEGKPVASPKWVAAEMTAGCDSKAVILDPQTVALTWKASPAQ